MHDALRPSRRAGGGDDQRGVAGAPSGSPDGGDRARCPPVQHAGAVDDDARRAARVRPPPSPPLATRVERHRDCADAHRPQQCRHGLPPVREAHPHPVTGADAAPVASPAAARRGLTAPTTVHHPVSSDDRHRVPPGGQVRADQVVRYADREWAIGHDPMFRRNTGPEPRPLGLVRPHRVADLSSGRGPPCAPGPPPHAPARPPGCCRGARTRRARAVSLPRDPRVELGQRVNWSIRSRMGRPSSSSRPRCGTRARCVWIRSPCHHSPVAGSRHDR